MRSRGRVDARRAIQSRAVDLHSPAHCPPSTFNDTTHFTALPTTSIQQQQQPFNGLWVSRYQKGKTNLDFTGARDSEWQWHQLGHMQVCTSLQTDNHASTHHSVFTGRMPFLPPNQQRQSTEGNNLDTSKLVILPTLGNSILKMLILE